ncbi:MAG: hypothetical protein V7782_10275, partial [Psychromonas sp.]
MTKTTETSKILGTISNLAKLDVKRVISLIYKERYFEIIKTGMDSYIVGNRNFAKQSSSLNHHNIIKGLDA